ncbi:MAG: hypothetical protein K6A32_07800 [Bacteroidales bacterium]|nr:hypothetical protein [Bacteroidales bacterium]
MKKFLFLFLFLCPVFASAQDVIVKTDGSTIISKVTEITGTEVKYKKFSNLEGPTYSLLKSEIQVINYENGEKESFSQAPGPDVTEEERDDPDDNNRVPDRMHMSFRAGTSLGVGEAGGIFFVQGGFGFDYQIARIPLFLETGLQYMNKGQLDWEYSYNNYSDRYRTVEENHCFYVPVLVSYHMNIGPNLFLQPFGGLTVGFSGTRLFFDSAVRLGLGFNFGRLYSNVGFDIGITPHESENSIYDGQSEKDHWANYNAFFTVGVNFLGRR